MSSAGIKTRSAYFGTWLLFVATVLYLDWSNARVLHVLLGVWAFVGVALAIAWLVWPGRLVYACVVASVVLLAAYAAEWTLQIHSHYIADPSLGLLGGVGIQALIWIRIFEHRWSAGNYLGAISEAYWLWGMVLTQLVLAAALLLPNPIIESDARKVGARQSS
jgi:hypothetical protein